MVDGLGAGWVLMLVFAVGGFAGIVLSALMVMASGGAKSEERGDFTE